MNVGIIGSGTSALIAAKTFLEYNYKVFLIDSENYKDNLDFKNKVQILPNLKHSPKFQNKPLINSIKKFKKKYKINTRNFFLVSSLLSGGLSNYWGGGLEIPSREYLKKYPFGNSILKEQSYINREIGINKKNYNFYNFFFKQKFIRNLLKKNNKSLYFTKFLLAVRQFDQKKLNLKDYHNIDLLYGYNKRIYNAKFEIPKLIQHKNFTYISNTFVQNIKKNKNKYLIITKNKKFKNIRFNKVIISAGTIGSTILVDRIRNLSEKYRVFHTPALKIIYYSFLLPFKISNKIRFSLALLKLNIHIQKDKFCGSFMQLNNISNSFFGVSKLNFFFTYLKKFFFVGNIFLPPTFSNTFIEIKKKKISIYSKEIFDKENIKNKLRKIINPYFKKFNLKEFFSQNLKFLDNGSDAHYTSTLINKKINGKNIINKSCELKNFKNIYVIDGSSIKEGLYYPNYFLMMYVRYIAKKIIKNEKNKNKY